MNYIKTNKLFKKTILFILFITVILVCASCNKTSLEVLKYSITDIDYVVSVPTALVDDSVIYLVLDSENANYYRYYLDTKKAVKIGTINNHLLSGKSIMQIDNILYFYVTVSKENKIVNTLYGIDLSDNTLSIIIEDNNSQHLTTLSLMNEKILTLKGDFINENNYLSYFNLYDTTTENSTVKNENIMNTLLKEGSSILNYCFYESEIYTLYEEMVNSISVPIINVYNDEFILEKTLDISKIKEYLFTTGISEIRMMGDYIFITNTSNYSIVGKIVDNTIKPILMQRNLEISNYISNSTLQENVFYVRKTNQFYILDIANDKLNEYSLDIKTNDIVRCVLTDKDNILIVLKSTNNIEKVLYLNRKDFTQILK